MEILSSKTTVEHLQQAADRVAARFYEAHGFDASYPYHAAQACIGILDPNEWDVKSIWRGDTLQVWLENNWSGEIIDPAQMLYECAGRRLPKYRSGEPFLFGQDIEEQAVEIATALVEELENPRIKIKAEYSQGSLFESLHNPNQDDYLDIESLFDADIFKEYISQDTVILQEDEDITPAIEEPPSSNEVENKLEKLSNRIEEVAWRMQNRVAVRIRFDPIIVKQELTGLNHVLRFEDFDLRGIFSARVVDPATNDEVSITIVETDLDVRIDSVVALDGLLLIVKGF